VTNGGTSPTVRCNHRELAQIRADTCAKAGGNQVKGVRQRRKKKKETIVGGVLGACTGSVNRP